MSYTGVRSDIFAVFRGREYLGSPVFTEDDTVMIGASDTANPDPSLFAWNEGWGAWTARIPAADCDRLYSAHSYAKYQGHRVNIMRIDDSGIARVYYSDENGAWAEANGFEQVNKYEFEKSVPAAELYDVYELQDDLLFFRWREANFARPQEVRPAGRRLR